MEYAVRSGGKRADGSVKATLVYKNYISVSCGSFVKPCRGRSLGNKRCHYTLAILLNVSKGAFHALLTQGYPVMHCDNCHG